MVPERCFGVSLGTVFLDQSAHRLTNAETEIRTSRDRLRPVIDDVDTRHVVLPF